MAETGGVARQNGRLARPELVWPGKYDEAGNRRQIPRADLPFQVIERVNESRATREASKSASPLSLFDVYDGDEGETFEDGWSNKLIWGDNQLVMRSLLKDFEGKIALIYIDPPFATGADFSFTAQVGDDVSIFKEPSLIEEKAYRDTWGGGLASYLDMMYSRLSLMRDLLRESGSLIVHIDTRVNSHLRLILDELFGQDHLVNEIAWCYGGGGAPRNYYPQKHDTLLWYAKGDSWTFNKQYRPYTEGTLGRGLTQVKGDRYKLSEEGAGLDDWWAGKEVQKILSPTAYENLKFPTQKPEGLLRRIVMGHSDPGDLVADFFCGSGTTMAVAEELERRWIGCDLGRWGIHVSRKRLSDVPECKPFEILNLGRYERQFWQGAAFGGGRQVTEHTLYEYIAFVLKLYGTEPVGGSTHLHGRKGSAVVHVGSVDAPVTIGEVSQALEETNAFGQKELHVLGWEWEMGLVGPDAHGSGQGGLMQEAARRLGVKLLLLQIPREVMEQQAVDRGDVRFFELAYLEVGLQNQKGPRSLRVTLEDFVVPNTELIPEEVREKIEKWSDYVDYWAVDWDFRNDSFTQGWVAYRTRKDRSLPLVSDPHEYEEPGTYRVAVKAIDVFGNDTTRVVEAEVG